MTKEEYIEYAKDPIKFISDFNFGPNAYNNHKVELLPLMEYQKTIINKVKSENYFILTKSRQMHISSLLAAYVCWCAIFKHKNNIVIISPNSNSAKHFFEKVKVILQNYYKTKFKEDVFITSTKTIELKNESRINSCGESSNAGRAEVIDLLILDEFSFFEHSEEILASSHMALSQKNGQCIMCSSVRYEEDTFYKMSKKALFGDNGYKEDRVLWYENPHYTEEWYSEITAKFPQTYRQEYDCIPTNKNIKKKQNLITFRIDDWMEKEITKRLLQKSAELGENYPISTYIRELILKDLTQRF